MKNVKRIAALSMLCLSLFATNITAYASVTSVPNESATISVKATIPACPKCHSNKFVVPHGLVAWCCLSCDSCFM